MARKLRVQYPGAIYHVMNRGDHLEVIFRDSQDPELFLRALDERILAEELKRRGWNSQDLQQLRKAELEKLKSLALAGRNHRHLQVDSSAPEHGRTRLCFQLPQN